MYSNFSLKLADEQQRYNREKPLLGDVLDVLSSAMNLLRRCRVNAALTIQLFSQLFHFINMWLFNVMVTEQQHLFCTRSWGIRLKRRLGRIETWAEKQGLELAADCHLCRIIQVMTQKLLCLMADKSNLGLCHLRSLAYNLFNNSIEKVD